MFAVSHSILLGLAKIGGFAAIFARSVSLIAKCLALNMPILILSMETCFAVLSDSFLVKSFY